MQLLFHCIFLSSLRSSCIFGSGKEFEQIYLFFLGFPHSKNAILWPQKYQKTFGPRGKSASKSEFFKSNQLLVLHLDINFFVFSCMFSHIFTQISRGLWFQSPFNKINTIESNLKNSWSKIHQCEFFALHMV